VLINRFWGENNDWSSQINTDYDLRLAAETSGDNFEVMLQGNETAIPVYTPYREGVNPIEFEGRVASNSRYSDRYISWNVQTSAELAFDSASWHQKLIVIDGATAYVTGMNVKGDDWDSSDHEVFDPRRMYFESSTVEREAVEAHEDWPDYEPRRDYGVRLEGPAVQDIERVFQTRWEDTLDDNAEYSEAATEFDLDPQADPTGSSLVQITTTSPNPDSVQAVYEAHVRAIQNAEEYIFIEDQYFRSPMINQAIIHQMETHPSLVLIAVSLKIDEYEGGAKFSYISDATFQELFGDRYLLMHLRAADLYLDEGMIWDTVTLYEQIIFTHSKLRLIDDKYISVGSTNMNNRGYLYEGEMNVEILDSGLATSLRREIFAQLVGERWESWLSNDPQNNLDVFRMAAEENAEILEWWNRWATSLDVDEANHEINNDRWPSGFVYPLEFSSNYWWDVSPDLF
jgi:phosphatidylserine/phosphatidylglycerophosphate/cardiolipin synthase-like enzyme